MAAQSSTWDEDPQGVSLLLATGRVRHDLLVIAEPALLTELDEAWGRPASRVRLSFLPGVRAPGGAGQEDALVTYERDKMVWLRAWSLTGVIGLISAIAGTAAALLGADGVAVLVGVEVLMAMALIGGKIYYDRAL